MLKTNANDMRDLNWPDACALAQRGATIYRASWNGKGIFCRVQYPDAGSKMSSPYFYIDTTGLSNNDHDAAARSCCPWVPSQTDMFARDWVVSDTWRTIVMDGERLGKIWDAEVPVTSTLVSGKTRTLAPTNLNDVRQHLLDLSSDDKPVLVISENEERWKQVLHDIDIVVTIKRSAMRGMGYTRIVVDLPCLTKLTADTVCGASTLTLGAHIFLVNP